MSKEAAIFCGIFAEISGRICSEICSDRWDCLRSLGCIGSHTTVYVNVNVNVNDQANVNVNLTESLRNLRTSQGISGLELEFAFDRAFDRRTAR